jgi:ribose 1,5-bisphosphokinase
MSSLVYVMGPSGSGKDSCLYAARTAMPPGTKVAFAHRYITRPAGGGGENHVALSEGEFALRQSLGLFALHWASNGWRYGIGLEMDCWLKAGLTVVVNGSREYFTQARLRYPGVVGVEISAKPEELRRRLLARGREDRAAVEARLARSQKLEPIESGLHHIDNSGPLEQAATALTKLLLEISG